MHRLPHDTKVLFFGTSDFAVPILEALVNNGYNIISVITAPDKPTGKTKALTPSPVKSVALVHGLPILQPKKLKDESFIESLRALKPDIGIIVAYGKFLPQSLIDLPEYSAINIHPSLLPKFRGPSPMQSAILNGEAETGITIIKIDSEMDHGPIIAQERAVIGKAETYRELSSRLARQSALLLIHALPAYLTGELIPRPQDHSLATFTKLLTIDDAEINPQDKVHEAVNKVRTLNPEPGTFFISHADSKSLRLKILKASLMAETDEANWHDFKPGQLFTINSQLELRLSDGAIVIELIQPEGKKPMLAGAFINGYRQLLAP